MVSSFGNEAVAGTCRVAKVSELLDKLDGRLEKFIKKASLDSLPAL